MTAGSSSTDSPDGAWLIIPILLGSIVLGWMGYKYVYLARVAASFAGRDVYYAADRGGLVPECTSDGAYGGLWAGIDRDKPAMPVEAGTPLLVLRNPAGRADWWQVRTPDGHEGFVHAACVLEDARQACSGSDGKNDEECLKRTGLPGGHR